MLEQLKLLVELQGIDSHLKEVLKSGEELPQKLAEIDRELEGSRGGLKKLETRLSELQKMRRNMERDVEAEAERIKKLASQSSMVKTNKEYQALLKEIEMAKQANWQREEELLNLMASIEEVEEEVDKRRKELKEKEELLNRRKEELKKNLEKMEGQAQEGQRRREEVIRGIDPELVKRYNFISQRLGVAVVAVEESACQGCHMRLSPQIMVELLGNKGLITCPNCNRILYVKENL